MYKSSIILWAGTVLPQVPDTKDIEMMHRNRGDVGTKRFVKDLRKQDYLCLR